MTHARRHYTGTSCLCICHYTGDTCDDVVCIKVIKSEQREMRAAEATTAHVAQPIKVAHSTHR